MEEQEDETDFSKAKRALAVGGVADSKKKGGRVPKVDTYVPNSSSYKV